MKPTLCIFIFICILSKAYSQDYDLIVNTNSDSIACNIDSIADASIYFEMKYNNNWIHTNINRNEVVEYKYDAINKKTVVFKPGTSYIEFVYNNVNDANLVKALKLKKNGKTLIIIGGAALVAAVVWGITGPLDHELGTVLEAGIVGFAGLGTMAVGIPMNITGKKRVEQINSIKNTAFNGIIIDLKPCAQYNLMTQNYQPGVMLRIRF